MFSEVRKTMFLIEKKQEKQERNCFSTEGKRKVTVTVNCVTLKRKFQKNEESAKVSKVQTAS